jgi:hypothetical protein
MVEVKCVILENHVEQEKLDDRIKLDHRHELNTTHSGFKLQEVYKVGKYSHFCTYLRE